MYQFLMVILLSFAPTIIHATNDTPSNNKNNVVTKNSAVVTEETINKDRQQSQKIVAQFEAYLRTLPENIVEEITQFRQDIAQLNKQKKQLYKTLSKQAQLYLAREQDFKKKLPVRDRRSLNKLRKDYMQRNAPKAPNAPAAPKASSALETPSAPKLDDTNNLKLPN